ncbi:TetR/AcrR family transcriptional regulator [Alloscardovia omnicolens]|uniref:TetR/AcrR family transcriptional regulator n=1 Tax=Alloscardovia omnicolens TaxID=419015 RepID=UPI003A6FE4E9
MGKQVRATKHRAETIAKREEIIRAASEIVGYKGSSNATLQDIADRVGMTRAGVLHHFGSKEDLLIEVMRYRDYSQVSHLPEKKMPEGAECFLHLIATAQSNAHNEAAVRLFVALSSESITEGNSGYPYFVQRYKNLRQELTQAFVAIAMERKWVIDMQKASQASAMILAAMDGIQFQWILSQQDIDMVACTTYAIRAAIQSVFPDKDVDDILYHSDTPQK